MLDELVQDRQLAFDVYVFSKVYSNKALLFARRIKKGRKKLALDLYDDYFSHHNDSRFVSYRQWLSNAVEISDLVLCSTARLMEIVREYNSSIQISLFQDILPATNKKHLKQLLENKMDRLKKKNHLKLIWFGVGDNPNFELGLKDLYDFSNNLFGFNHIETNVELVILTNARALNHRNLMNVSKLPISHSICLWDLEKEKKLLEDSFLCFLPVNAQNFSIAKTHNRATTALLSGCQILSVGFPLYKIFNDFIYRDPEMFINDLGKGSFRLNDQSIDALFLKLKNFGDAEVESCRFSNVIKELVI